MFQTFVFIGDALRGGLFFGVWNPLAASNPVAPGEALTADDGTTALTADDGVTALTADGAAAFSVLWDDDATELVWDDGTTTLIWDI